VDIYTGKTMEVDHFNRYEFMRAVLGFCVTFNIEKHRNIRNNSIQNLDYATGIHQKMNTQAGVALHYRFRRMWLEWVRQGRRMPAPLPAPDNYF
jgi:hypothetical protein